MDYLVGKTLEGRYQFVDVLGKGGMSMVYKALDVKLGKSWAIKQVEKTSSELDKQLEMEAEILKKVDHPALPRIVDVFEDDKNILIVMDYIDGVSLDKKLRDEKFINEKELIEYAKMLCDALSYLHSQRPNPIIYRDLKPGNIMITRRGKIKLIDFGIAREFKEQKEKDTVILGTEGYAAPEQIGNHRTDTRTDIYSFGATIYHLATGKGQLDPPYGFVPARLINSSISEGLEKILDKCVKDNPEERYQKVDEILYDLENIHRLNRGFYLEKKRRMKKLIPPTVALTLSAGVLITGIVMLENQISTKYTSAFRDVEASLRRQEIDKALVDAEEAISIDNDREEVYIEIGQYYLDRGMYEECIDFLNDNVIETNSSAKKNDNIRYILGLAYFNYQNYESASENFNKVDKKEIRMAELYAELSQYFVNFTLEESRDKIIASMDQFEKIIHNENDIKIKLEATLLVSKIYLENPTVFPDGADSAIDLLEKVEAQMTGAKNPLIYEQLGNAYKNKALNNIIDKDIYNEYILKALVSFNKVLEMGYKQPEIYVNVGELYRYQEDYLKSEKTFQDMIDLYPKNYRGYAQLALLYNDLELTRPREERDFSDVIKYYELAKKFATTKDQTIELQRLESIVDELNQ